MRSVGIKVLKNKLSEYVRLAAAGEIILICDRDHVIAELRAAQPAHGENIADALLVDLVRNGLATLALAPSQDVPESRPVAPLGALLDELNADRADR